MLNRKFAGEASAAFCYHIQFHQMAGCIYNKHNNRKSTLSQLFRPSAAEASAAFLLPYTDSANGWLYL